MRTSKHHSYMRSFGILVVTVIAGIYIAGCAPMPPVLSEPPVTTETPIESMGLQPGLLVDDALRQAINDLPAEQTGTNLLVLKEGVPPAGSQLLTAEIDGLNEMTATVLAINELDRKQSSVSFNVPGQSGTDGEGLIGELEWNSAGAFALDAPLALGMPTVTLPTEAGDPLIIDWQSATVLGVERGQSGDDLQNIILKLYPSPETTWKICPDDAACKDVGGGCKYPICIPGFDCFCPFGDEAPMVSQPNALIDDALRQAINDLPDKQVGSNILVLKEGLPPAGNQGLTATIDGLKEVIATVLAINELNRKQSSFSFSVPGLLGTKGEGLTGEFEWDSAGLFTFDTALALGMPTVTVPTETGKPVIILWQRAAALHSKPGQSGDEIKNAILKLYPPPGTMWKSCPECDQGTVPVGCEIPFYLPGWGWICPFGEEVPQ